MSKTNSDWIAINVNPDETYVFNSELRAQTNPAYKRQKITLAQLLSNRAELSKMICDRFPGHRSLLSRLH